MSEVRPAAVAGLFYAGERAALQRDIDALLDRVQPLAGEAPRALIVPHAGYVYSGAAAAQAYARLARWRAHYRRVVILGPPHRVPVRGMAVDGHARFATPLGEVAIDRAACAALCLDPQVAVDDAAHAAEHAIEVQLPFLQTVLDDFTLVPLLVGDLAPAAVAAAVAPWWDDPQTLLLVSSDLSHFLDYDAARARDAATDAAIMALDADVIGPARACGCRALNGLLYLARQRGADIERLALCNSGDSAGDRDRVVGYAAYALT